MLLGDALVAYALHRSRRRTIGFTVGRMAGRARPSWVALSAVDTVLRERSAWVMTKLVQARERQQRLESGRIVWADGVQLPYLGQPPAGGAGCHAKPQRPGRGLHAAAPDTPARLVIGLPADASATQIRDAVLAWLMRDARRHFTERLDHFAPLLGVQWTSLRLSSAETRWGQRQGRWLHSPELAPAALPPRRHRLRGGARTGPPARDGPQPALLEHRGHRGARLRRAAQPACVRNPRPCGDGRCPKLHRFSRTSPTEPTEWKGLHP